MLIKDIQSLTNISDVYEYLCRLRLSRSEIEVICKYLNISINDLRFDYEKDLAERLFTPVIVSKSEQVVFKYDTEEDLFKHKQKMLKDGYSFEFSGFGTFGYFTIFQKRIIAVSHVKKV